MSPSGGQGAELTDLLLQLCQFQPPFRELLRPSDGTDLGGQLGHTGLGVLELMVEDTVAVDVCLDAPVFDLNGPLQLVEVGGGAMEDLEEPAPQRQDGGTVVHIVVVGLRVDVPNEGVGVRGMVAGEPCHLSVSHLLGPPCRLRQPVFSWDIELRGSSIPVEAVPLGALF